MRKRLRRPRILLCVLVALLLTTVSVQARTLIVAGKPLILGGVTVDGLNAAIEGFRELHPDVEVMLYPMSVDAFKVGVIGGAPPDVILVDGPLVSSWAVSGLLHPLSSYIARDGVDKEEFILPSWQQSEWQSDVWALPLIVDPNFALVYNTELFAMAGIGHDSPPRTIDELESIFGRLTRYDAEGNLSQIAMIPWQVFGRTSANVVYTWSWIFGGDFYDYTTQTITADHPSNVKALEWIRSYHDYYGPAVNALSVQGGMSTRFIQGLEAMLFGHTGLVRDVAKNAPYMEFGIAPMPVHEDSGTTNATWIGGWTIGIPNGASDPDLSWEFIKYVTATEEGTYRFASTSGWFTGYLPSPVFREFREDPLVSPFLDIAVNAVHVRPVIPIQEMYTNELNQAILRVLQQNVPAAEALGHVTQLVQAELDVILD